MGYIFDTDTLSNLVRRQPNPSLVQRLARTPASEHLTTSITLGELFYGAHRSVRTDELVALIEDRIVPRVMILPFDEAAASVYGQVRADLERAGTPLDDPDVRIASIALAGDHTVVTGNVRHFARVPDLRVENWLTD